MTMNLQHPIDLIHDIARIRDQETAVQFQTSNNSSWQTLSYADFALKAQKLSQALLNFDLHSQDKVAIFAANSEQWLITDIAIMQIRAITVPIYATNTPEQAAFIINDSNSKVVFVGELEQYQAVMSVIDQCPAIERVILMSKTEQAPQKYFVSDTSYSCAELIEEDNSDQQYKLKQRLEEKSLDDLASLIYTSGTTGNPKGVMTDFRALASTVAQHDLVIDFNAGDQSMAFLPLTHVYERSWSLFVLCKGGKNALLHDPQTVKEALLEIKPHVMCVVPRLLEKIYSAVHEKVEVSSFIKKMIFKFSVCQGKKAFLKPKHSNSLLYKLADKLVLSKLRDVLGGNFKFIPCGGAKLNDNVNQFFQNIGIHVLCGYGLTETTATVTCNQIGKINVGDNGLMLPNVEVKIGKNDEILVRGDTVMQGYYNNPEETSKVFSDGWFKTGDAGYLDDNNRLFITDRIKELMKTSNGKYIAPQHVEGMIGRDAWIDQIAIVAEGRNFVSALIVPNFEAIEAWAIEKKIKVSNHKKLIKHIDVIVQFNQRLKGLQEELANYEKVKKFTLLPYAFSIDKGEMTPTLKLRRKVITQHFETTIEAMYK
jgi:long-chain acyl-CoA synthetase